MDKIKKHIIKKYIGFLVFPLLLLMMFSPVGEAQAVTDITSKVKIDNLKITIASTGSETEGIHGSNDTSMKLKYSGKFSFPNVAANEIKEGDYFIVKAPDNLSLTDGSLDLIDSTSNIKMGTVRVDNANHRLVFTFSDKVKDKQNIRGDFVAEATETLQKEGKTVTYVLPDGKTQTITYKVNKYEQTDVIGETITKYGYNDNNKARAHFQMKINRAKKDMTGHVVKITDDVSKGAFANYVEGTFYMHEAEFETTNTNSSAIKHLGDEYEITTDPEVYKANSDKKALLTFVNGKRGFELLMPTNMGTKSFFLTYDTSSPADTSTISNSAQYLIDNQPQLIWEKYGGSIGTRTEATFNLKTVKSVGASVTADIAGKIKITKYDEADADVKLAGVVFEIREKTTNNLVGTVTTNADGIALSEALSDGKYIVKEKTPKSGYQVNSQEFEVEMKDGKGVPLNISNKRVTVDFEATKTWVNGKATDYKEVKLGLYVHKEGQTVADAKPVTGNYTPEVTVSNGVYTYKWKNQLPERDVDGSKLVYSVRELQDQTNLPLAEAETVVGGTGDYVVSYNADKTKITNTYKPAKISVAGTKTWDDSNNQDGKRPDKIKVILNKTVDGQTTKVTEKEVTKDNWDYEFNDLPKYENGKEITYSIDEEAVPGYEKEVTGYNLKNSHTQEKVSVAGTKTWDDSNNQDGKRPDKIKVILNKTVDGQTTKVTEKEVTKDNWDYEFNDLPKYENGKEITYSIDEEAVPGYEKEVTGYNLKNSHTQEKVSVAGTKTWDDSNNQDGKRPDKIKVILNKTVDGQTTKVTEKEVTKDNWDYEFNDLPKYENGKEITYSIDEEAVPGYEKEVTGYNLKNSHTQEKVSVAGTKTWDDSNNQDGKRPDKIKVILNKTVDGQTTKVTEKEVTKDNWDYEFNDLPKYENGKEITYSIDEEAVPGYEKEVTGYNLKNSHTQEKVSVAGTKTWDDSNNQDGKRPDKIKVILNKTVDGQTTKVTEKEVTKDSWDYEFTNLPKFEGGKEITYSIDEEAVPGYEKTIDGYNLKNSYTPEVVNVQGTKTWDDSNNQDGKRPDKIKVILNKTVDGQTTKVAEKEITKDNWNYEFTNLPKFEGGKEITYSIDEEAVPGYEKTIDGYNLKNSYTPEVVNVQGTKTWNDANNQDGKRPDKIKVILNKTVDGVTTKVAEKEVTKDNWNYEFTNLPKFEGGKEIAYSIDEEAVPGYEKTIDGYNLKNSYTPEVVNVQGTKTWDDSNNQDGKRPDKIKVILNKTVDGVTTKVAEKEVTKDNWNYEFTNLPKFEGGKEITYSIDEEAVPGYEKTIDGYNLKNSYTPEVVNVQGTKTWVDNNDQAGKRPGSIKVILNKTVDGRTTKVAEKEVTAKDNWNYAFNDLPKYENGKEIKYSIDEVDVPGYEKTIKGYNLENKYIPKKPGLPKTGSTPSEVGGLGVLGLLAGYVLIRRKNKAN